jgi:serralysin
LRSSIEPLERRLYLAADGIDPCGIREVPAFIPFGSLGTFNNSFDSETPSPSAIRVAPSNDYRIESLNTGFKWGTGNLTFSFFSGGSYYGSESSPTPVSDAVKANVRFILADIISPLINVTFTEVPDSQSSYGLMRFLCSSSASYAYAYVPTGGDTNVGTSADRPGDVVLNPSNDVVGTEFNSQNNSFRSGPGSHGFTALIHEIGHALGLKHPFESPSLPRPEENQDNTVMTYNFLGGEPATMMPYDILTLQYFYGAKTSTRSTDTTYAFKAVDDFSPGGGNSSAPSSTFGRMRNTLWDGGGIDTVELSALPATTAGYRIDVRPGGWITDSDAFESLTYDGSLKTTSRGSRLPFSAELVEDIVVTRSNDTIFLNAAANRVSGYVPNQPGGADIIQLSDQLDTLDLSQFSKVDVTESQVGNDLAIDLKTSGKVTIKDYFAVVDSSRITILYADPPPAATISDVVVTEGNIGETIATFTITLSVAASKEVSVTVATEDGTATKADNDYLPLAADTKVRFAAGQTTQSVVVRVRGDRKFEPDETFSLVLSAPEGVVIGDGTAVGTIQNDDADVPVVTVSNAQIVEGQSGTTAVRASVTLSKPSTKDVSVFYRTADGTATVANADYAPVADRTQLVIPAGQTSATIEVVIIGDKTFELDETFRIELQDASDALVDENGAIVTIENDDRDPATLPTVHLMPTVVVETTGPRTVAEFVLGLTGEFPAPFWLDYRTGGPGTARPGSDYTATSGRVKVLPGESEKRISVIVAGDRLRELDEFFTLTVNAAAADEVTIRNPLADQYGLPANQTRGYIIDDDSRFFVVRAGTRSLEEGGTASFTVEMKRMASFGDVLLPNDLLTGLPAEATSALLAKIRFNAFFKAGNSIPFGPGSRSGGPPSRESTSGRADFGYLADGNGLVTPTTARQFDVVTTQSTRAASARPSSRTLMFQVFGGAQAGKPLAMSSVRIIAGASASPQAFASLSPARRMP